MNVFEQKSLQEICAHLPPEHYDALVSSYQFARQQHEGVLRSSGAPFLSHILGTVKNIADWTHDPTLTISALLHDVMDNKNVYQSATLKDICALAGNDVAQIVNIVHELGDIQGRNLFWGIETEAGKDASLAIRMQAFLVKLAAGLEMARDLKSIQNDTAKSQQRGRDLLTRHVPLAAQLGMWDYKRQLEDLCLAAISPNEYQQIIAWQQQTVEKYRERLELVAEQIRLACERQGLISKFEFHLRHAYSVYQLLSPKWTTRLQDAIKSSLNIDQLVRLNLLTETSNDCYLTLGIVHRIGSPSHDFLRDFVAIPKPNGYSALHTAIQIDPKQPGIRLRINIRTHAMDEIGRLGILYRPENKLWMLKDEIDLPEQDGSKQCIATLLNTLKLPTELARKNAIIVLTPQGKRIHLPRGATPLDFAYAIYTGLGDKFSYATVNHQTVEISYTLRDGDSVEIHTNQNATPQFEWLEHVQTARARQKINHWLANAPREIGKTRFQKALARQEIEATLPETQLKIEDFVRHRAISLETILDEIGNGRIDPDALVDEIFSNNNRNALIKAVFSSDFAPTERVWVKLAECCQPDYPDEIVGCMRKRIVMVHRRHCANASRAYKRLPMKWEKELPQPVLMRIRLKAEDRQGLVRDVAGVAAEHFYNLKELHATGNAGEAEIQITLEFPTVTIPEALFKDFRAIPGVSEVFSPDMKLIQSHPQAEEHITGGMSNPYSPGRPIFDKAMFYGRRQELSALQHYLLPATQPSAVMLCGQRRIGKTTLAWRICKKTLIRRAYLPVFMDISTSQKENDQKLLYKLNQHIQRELEPRGITLNLIERGTSIDETYSRFEQNLELIYQQSKKRLLLILDEFEAALTANQNGILSDAFFLHLRTWSQIYPAAFIIVGSLRLVQQITERFPELANVFQPYHLGPLKEFNARQLIVEPARYRLEYDENAIEMIHNLTRQYPYYIHLLCARVYNQAGETFKTQITLEQVEAIRQEMTSALSRSNFAHLWNQNSAYHEHLLYFIAAQGGQNGWLPRDKLATLCSVDNFSLELALRELLELETIEEQLSNGAIEYRIRLPLFEGWIMNNFSLPHLLAKRQNA